MSRGFEKIVHVNRFTLDVPDLQNYRKTILKEAADVLNEHGLPEENLVCFQLKKPSCWPEATPQEECRDRGSFNQKNG